MFRVLVVDDHHEDRELLMMEIEKALASEDVELRFFEASSVAQAKKLLSSGYYDLMTLDIEFDRLNEGIDALPEFFDTYPTLNIIVVSGKLNKSEVAERLFRFTKDNVFKGKRWARHFDVLDKKDKKEEAIRRAYSFAFKHSEVASKVRELFLLAESYLEQEMIDKCLEVYERIQNIAPGESESDENLRIIKKDISMEKARKYLKNGDTIVASLLLGHHIEKRLKQFTRRGVGRAFGPLSDCIKELMKQRRISQSKENAFHLLIQLRNKAIHHPATITREDFQQASRRLDVLDPGGG